MNYKQFEFKKRAEKFLKSRTRKEQVRILAKIYKLPDGDNILKMEGYDNRYRLRIGDFRVIYELKNEPVSVSDSETKTVLIVLIVTIGNRGNVY